MSNSDYSWTTGGDTQLLHRRLIARGGFGEVHEILSEANGTVFARKLIRVIGPVTQQDIDNERDQIVSFLNNGGHENIISILCHGWLKEFNYFFIDMELCDMTLHDYIAYFDQLKYPPFDIVPSIFPVIVTNECSAVERMLNIWTIGCHIVRGLEFMHAHSVVHRDVKPQNSMTKYFAVSDDLVLYSRRVNAWKLTDFGISAEATSRKDHTTRHSRGTASYRAPELLRDPPTFTNKVDIWALGCIMYELATLKRAFGDTWHIKQYDHNTDTVIDVTISSVSQPPEFLRYYLLENTRDLLKRQPLRRPRAKTVCRVFSLLCQFLELVSCKLPTSNYLLVVLLAAPTHLSYLEWKELVKSHPDNPSNDHEVLYSIADRYEEKKEKLVAITLRQVLKEKAALDAAILNDDVDIIKMFMEVGATPSDQVLTPLHLAAITGSVKSAKDLIEAIPNSSPRDHDIITPMHFAALYGEIDIMELLSIAGTDLSCRDQIGCTPMHMAAFTGQPKIIENLINAGVDPKVRDNNGRTPLHYLGGWFNVDVLSGLSKSGMAVLGKEFKFRLGDIKQTARTIINAGGDVSAVDDTGSTPIFYAAYNGRIDAMKIFISAGADVSSRNKKQLTPMGYAADGGCVDAINILTKGNASVMARDNNGWTAMFYAARKGHVKAIEALAAAGANVSSPRDDNGSTPIFYAAMNGHVDVIKALIRLGASAEIKNFDGETPRSVGLAKSKNSEEMRVALRTPTSLMETYRAPTPDSICGGQSKRASRDNLSAPRSAVSKEPSLRKEVVKVQPTSRQPPVVESTFHPDLSMYSCWESTRLLGCMMICPCVWCSERYRDWMEPLIEANCCLTFWW